MAGSAFQSAATPEVEPQDSNELTMKSTDTWYVVDREGRITAVGGGWDVFARTNEAPEIRGQHVVGHLWSDYVDSQEVRDLYDRIFDVVRGRQRPIEFGFRCDGPASRRKMRMHLSPMPHGAIELRTRTLSEIERASQALPARSVPRTDELLLMCSYCNRIRVPGVGWCEVERAIATIDLFTAERMPGLGHGICDPCLLQLRALIDGAERSSSAD